MKAIATALVLAVVLAAPAAAKQKPPRDCHLPHGACELSLEEIQQLANTPPTITQTVREVTPAEAYGAADQPGAEVETANGMSIEEATGVAETPNMEVEDDGGGGGGEARTCQSSNLAAQYGGFPYDRTISDHTYWCWNSATWLLTYRSTWVTQYATICNPLGTYSYRWTGGVGQGIVGIEAGAYYTCPTPVPWWPIQFQDCLHDAYYAWGSNIAEFRCF